MKIAVIGGGSTYTPELVSGLSRERERIDVSELALHDIDAERREVVGGLAARMLDARRASPAPLEVTGDLDRALDGADFVLVQIRVGGQAARLSRRDRPARVRLHRPGDDRRRRARQGAAHGPRRARHRRARARAWRRTAPGSSTSRTRSGSSPARCSTPATARSACATSRSASSARWRALLGVAPERVVVDQVGLNHLTWVRRRARRRRRRAAGAARRARRRARRRASRCRARLLEELGAIPSYYLRYFYAHDAVLAEQLGGTPRAATRRRDRARAARALPRPGARREAGAARAARRRVLQRGGDRPRRVARGRRRRRARGRHPQRRHARGARRRRRRRGAGAHRARRPGAAAAGAARAGAARPVAARGGLRAARRRRRRVSGDPRDARKALLAHPLVGQDDRGASCVERLLAAERAPRRARAGRRQ